MHCSETAPLQDQQTGTKCSRFSLCASAWRKLPAVVCLYLHILILFTVPFLITAVGIHGGARAQEDRPLILILHSYATDMQWTNELNEEIMATLAEKAPRFRIRSEFMDTKNFLDAEHLQTLRDLYSQKYSADQPAAIISTDNIALNFLEAHGTDLFPGALAIATGINNADPSEARNYVKTVISEDVDHVGTLTQATTVWPATKTINVIMDETPTGSALLRELQDNANALATKYNFRIIRGKTVQELETFAAHLDRNNLIYMFPFHRAIDGHKYAEGIVAGRIARAAAVPVASSSSYQLGSGVLLSRSLTASSLGRQAAEVLLDALNGQSVPDFYAGEPARISLYDYEAVKRFKINDSLLPADAIFLNRPVGFLQKHQKALLPAAGIIVVLFVISALLLQNLQKHKALIVNNEKIMELDKEVIETQRELLTTLGEVIDARSETTGNHVTRVTRISMILAQGLSLPKWGQQLLEPAVPLHDIGKIGIPENILQKPGKLTANEFDIVKTHTTIGKTILQGSDRDLMKMSCIIAHQHHEKWDGNGYPQNLAGDEIDIYARIVSVADVYDALTSPRCYRSQWSESDALTHMIAESGKSFDPQIIDIFVKNFDEIRSLQVDPPSVARPLVQPPQRPAPSEGMYHI